jgi:hypothetical protein
LWSGSTYSVQEPSQNVPGKVRAKDGRGLLESMMRLSLPSGPRGGHPRP